MDEAELDKWMEEQGFDPIVPTDSEASDEIASNILDGILADFDDPYDW